MTLLGRRGPAPAFSEFTAEQEEQINALRDELNSAYGTDNAHWTAAAVVIGSGVLDRVRDEARRDALSALVNPTPVQETALSEVIAADVWDSRTGARTQWSDLSPYAQESARLTAQRYLSSLRSFLSRRVSGSVIDQCRTAAITPTTTAPPQPAHSFHALPTSTAT